MQYNSWDPNQLFSKLNSPTIGIAVRYDLSPDKSLKKNNGAIDTKITDLNMSEKQSSWAISGPTHQNQIPFQWSMSTKYNPEENEGLPDLWNFDW